MAFITVSFPGRQRDVYIDGEVTGLTSETLSVEKGTHTIHLGKPPFLIVNASDMSLGTRFEFTQDEFDVICSDLSSYPIARAVAASSEFLGLLSPLTIHNYAASASGCGWTEPDWVGNAIDDRDVLSTRFRDATNVRSYRDGKSRPYLHPLDGGVSDNIGLRGPIRSTASTDPAFSLRRMIDLHRVHRLAVIVVNAKTEAASRWDTREKAPGVLSVLKTAANTPMGDYSFETVELFQRLVDEWNQASAGRKACEGILRDHCPEARLAGGCFANRRSTSGC